MLAELFAWWTEQMRGLAEPLARRASGRPKDALVLACEPGPGGRWRILRRRKGETTHLATLSSEDTDAAWREALMPRHLGTRLVVALGQPFLTRRASLPVAAASNLERVLGYEMDRLTPFTADDVLFSHRVLSRDSTAGTLLVELILAPKAWVREPLERLATLGVRPGAVEEYAGPLAAGVSPPDQRGAPPGGPRANRPPRRIPLDHADPAYRARVRLVRRIGAGTCVGLAAAVLIVPFIRQATALGGVADQIAGLRPGMEQVDALRKRIAAGSAGAGQLEAVRLRQTAALQMLGVLTDGMPDDTFLTSITLRHAHLTIEGRSTAATKLIATLAADPRLTNPSFGAPVVRAENGTDMFTIQAGFGP